MATMTTNYAAVAAITCTLASLTNGSWRQSAVVDNTANKYLDALVMGSVQVGTTPTVGNVIEVYAYGWIDAAPGYTAGASGSDAAYTADGEEDELRLVGVITVDADSNIDYVWGPFPIAAAFGGILPPKWGLVFKNGTGATLHATGTNNAVKFVGIKFDIA